MVRTWPHVGLGRRLLRRATRGHLCFKVLCLHAKAAEVYIGLVVVMISVGVGAYLAEGGGVILRKGCWETGRVLRCWWETHHGSGF